MQTFELRQYTMQPGKRDAFVALFDREFADPLEDAGCVVVGQFCDRDDPNRFVWIRGHADMPSRRQMMHAFYDGEHWKQHRMAANACIADSDNVLLLKPAWPGAGFANGGTRAPQGATALPRGTVTVNICYFAAPEEAFTEAFRQLVPQIEASGSKFLAGLVTEPAPNNFPRHPVREGEHVFVWFILSEGDPKSFALPTALTRRFLKPMETHHLTPTPRSRLHA